MNPSIMYADLHLDVRRVGQVRSLAEWLCCSSRALRCHPRGEGRKGRKGYRLHSGPGYFRDRPKLFLDVLSDQPKSEDNADPKRKAKAITVFPSVLKF